MYVYIDMYVNIYILVRTSIHEQNMNKYISVYRYLKVKQYISLSLATCWFRDLFKLILSPPNPPPHIAPPRQPLGSTHTPAVEWGQGDIANQVSYLKLAKRHIVSEKKSQEFLINLRDDFFKPTLKKNSTRISKKITLKFDALSSYLPARSKKKTIVLSSFRGFLGFWSWSG